MWSAAQAPSSSSYAGQKRRYPFAAADDDAFTSPGAAASAPFPFTTPPLAGTASLPSRGGFGSGVGRSAPPPRLWDGGSSRAPLGGGAVVSAPSGAPPASTACCVCARTLDDAAPCAFCDRATCENDTRQCDACSLFFCALCSVLKCVRIHAPRLALHLPHLVTPMHVSRPPQLRTTRRPRLLPRV